jgi:predicted dehydrogenase
MIASVHRRSAVLAGGELVGVLGSRVERARQAAEKWGAATAYASVTEVANGDADVVHVCSPNSTHAPFVEALVAAGKHVICEKPLATTVADASRMKASADAAGVVATVPFVYRYHPIVRKIRAKVQSGELGAINLIHGHYLQDWLLSAQSSNWRVNPDVGGASRAFGDIGSHWCDLIEWVTGHRLEALVAQTAIAVPRRSAHHGLSIGSGANRETIGVQTEDIATVMFRTAQGVPGSLIVSQVAAGRKNRLWFELDCSAGSAAFDQEQPETMWLGTSDGSRSVVRDSGAGSADERRLSYLPAGHSQGYADCFAAFVADTYAEINGGSPEGLPTFADGARSAEIVDAVLRSARESSWTAVAA